MNMDFGPSTTKGRGKGPKGKRELRRIRLTNQTAHELSNKARKRAELTEKRERLSRTDTRTTVLLHKIKGDLL